jgi:hypothetical protein
VVATGAGAEMRQSLGTAVGDESWGWAGVTPAAILTDPTAGAVR